MSPIERVRAVVEAGTPAPDATGILLPTRESQALIALAANLAPAFVELWEAAEAWQLAEYDHGIGAASPDPEEVEIAAVLFWHALAALNTAAAREVGE